VVDCDIHCSLPLDNEEYRLVDQWSDYNDLCTELRKTVRRRRDTGVLTVAINLLDQ
jgi:hypothetical protein